MFCLVLACTLAHADLAGPKHLRSPLIEGVAFSPPPSDTPLDNPIQVKRPSNVDLSISLDQQLYDLLAPAIHEYAHRHHLRIRLQRGTCGQSASALRRGLIDIGGFCCPPGRHDRLPGLRFHTLGIGALAILAHPKTDIRNLSQQQVAALFSGQTRRFTFVKGRSPLPVYLVTRLHCRSRPGHWHLILPREDNFFSLANQTGGIDEMLGAVRGYIGALGYETLYWTSQLAPDLKIVHIDGLDPRDPQALLDGRYPYYRVFNITTWEGQNDTTAEHVASLLTWLRQRFARIAEDAGMIPADKLREAGWKFSGDELIGEPE